MSDSRPPITMHVRFPISPDDRPPTQPPAVDHSNVLRELRQLRYSPQEARIGRRVPGILTIAKMAGMPIRTVYEIINSGRMTRDQAAKLSDALKAMQDRGG
jgi:hypothetical protein